MFERPSACGGDLGPNQASAPLGFLRAERLRASRCESATCGAACRRRVWHARVGAPVGQAAAGPAVPDRHRPVSSRTKSRDGEAPVATKAIVGEKVGMTQIWDDQHRAIPVTVVRVSPVRVVQVKTPEREGYSALQVTWGHRRSSTLTKPEQGHFDRAGVDPGRRLVELRLDDASELRGGPAADRRPPARRGAGRRHRRVQGEGVRRGDEAPQLQGPGRLARQPQEAPLARARSVPAPRRPGCSRAPGWPAGWVASR